MNESKEFVLAIYNGVKDNPEAMSVFDLYPKESLEYLRDKAVEYNDPELDDAIALFNEIIAAKD